MKEIDWKELRKKATLRSLPAMASSLANMKMSGKKMMMIFD